MVGVTPWTQGSIFYFLGPCLVATSRNTGWMDIHEIFRIWTQEAIGYTVSRLSRLFQALQTRCGGGLRSRSASCFQYEILYILFDLFVTTIYQATNEMFGIVDHRYSWKQMGIPFRNIHIFFRVPKGHSSANHCVRILYILFKWPLTGWCGEMRCNRILA